MAKNNSQSEETNTMEKPVRREGILYRKLDEEGILFDSESNAVHLLNATSELIWDCCDGLHDTGRITEAVLKRYRVAREQAVRDVVTALCQFRELGLLEK